MKNQLLQKIEDRSARVSVIGLGYVGLPLATALAEAGFHVTGLDVSHDKVERLNAGESYIPDIPGEDVKKLVGQGLLDATTDFSVLKDVDAISICVPTPLLDSKVPDLSYIEAATEQIARYAHPGLLVVLESTTYPGTTTEIIQARLTADGLVAGEDLFLACSPERIDPGNEQYGMRNMPKIVGGVTSACFEVASALYATAVDTIVSVSSTETAELVKLLENTFRAVNIGLVNELAFMCDKLGVDVWEVIGAAATKPFGFMPFYPGPGVGGHCIPIDPHYLLWKLKQLKYNARFIELASEINERMPAYVVSRVSDALNNHRKPLNGSQVIVVGVAYKPNVDDVRESPALDVIHLLREKGAEVSYNDPYVPSLEHEGLPGMASVELTAGTLASADCVVITTHHASYDWAFIAQHTNLILDTRNATAQLDTTAAEIVRL